jgi:YbgC/YbaW family acyl-CoA thioester hydrolase
MSAYPIEILHTLRAMTRARQSLLSPAVLRSRVGLLDVDENLHMNNARYTELMNRGRMDLAARSGLLSLLLRRRLGFVVGAVSVRYRKEMRLGQAFELRTAVLHWDHRWTTFEQRFVVDGRVRAVGLACGKIRGDRGFVPAEEVLRALGEEPPPAPEIPDHLAAWFRWQEREKGRLP